MSSKPLTKKQVKKKFRHIVNSVGHEFSYVSPEYETEEGELVDTGRYYYTDRFGYPSCIVGHLLEEVSPSTLRILHTHEWLFDIGYTRPKEISFDVASEYGDIKNIFTEEAIKFICRVQYNQDRGNSWGEAVDLAIKGIGS